MESTRTGLLKGEVSIVTGSGRGIGRAIAEALAACGSKVCVVARSADEIEAVVAAVKTNGGQAIGCVADVTNWEAVQKMAESVLSQLGPPTLLVNNAGSAAGLGSHGFG